MTAHAPDTDPARERGGRAVNRRRVLSAAGTALVTAVAGCGGRSRRTDETRSRDHPSGWPSAARDAANSRHAPGASLPTERSVAWRTAVGSLDRYPPLVTDERVVVLTREALVGLNRTGEEQWSVPVDPERYVAGAPTVHPREGWVALGTDDGRLRLFDVGDGALHFERRFETAVRTAAVAPARDRMLYVATDDGHIHALRRDGDGGRWTTQWTHEPFGTVEHAPAAGDGLVVATTAGVERLDREGQGRWRRPLPEPAATRPTLAGGTVLVGTRGHRLYAFDAETGERSWWRTIIENAHAGESIEGIAATPGRVYVTDSRALHALDPRDGQRRWRHHDWEHSFGPPVAVDGGVLVATDDGLFAFGPDGGPGVGSVRPDPVRWRVTPPGSPDAVVVAGDRTYLTVGREERDELLELR